MKEFRLKLHPNALPLSLIIKSLKLCKWKTSESLLDPFCGCGSIPGTALILKGKKVYGSDNNPIAISYSKINCKKCKFCLLDIKDLNKKFKNIDWIITDPPIATFTGYKSIENLYSLFFKKAKLVLKKDGRICIISMLSNPFKRAAKGFKLIIERRLTFNNVPYYILVFKNENPT